MTTTIDRRAPAHINELSDKNHEKTAVVVDASHGEIAYRPLVKDSFSYFSVFSLAFSCINSWVAIIYGLSAGLNSGGPTTREFVRLACEFSASDR